jgi:hypothetical protein
MPGPYYEVSMQNRRASKLPDSPNATVIGSDVFTAESFSFTVKILSSHKCNLYIGVAPHNIDQTQSSNQTKCGWYLYGKTCNLFSGPPQNYLNTQYSVGKLRQGSTVTVSGVHVVK